MILKIIGKKLKYIKYQAEINKGKVTYGSPDYFKTPSFKLNNNNHSEIDRGKKL